MSSVDDQLAEQVHALKNISAAVASEFDFKKLCHVAAEQACILLQCRTVLVPILNEDHTEYIYLSGFGENTEDIIGESLPIDIGVCGWVLKHRKPWWKGVLQELLPHERTMWEKEASNLLLMPLKGKNSFLGGLACIDKKNGFNEMDFELLEIIATPIALALENSLLVNNLENTITQRTAELLKEKDKAEKSNDEKSEFLANISHELRTPMHAILSYSSMGIEHIDSADKSKLLKYYESIHKSGNRLILLLDDLLNLSKIEAGEVTFNFSNTSLYNVVKEAVLEYESVAIRNDISINFPSIDFDANIAIDVNKITQVLHNLLSNALKFSEKGSEILISLTESDAINEDYYKNDDFIRYLTITISDTGIGIPEEELDTVFDKFVQSSRTQAHAGGTGLGLCICKDIISKHKGIIYAENNTTKGVTFTILLPKIIR